MSTRVRLDPARRREQLLDLGVELLSDRRLEDVSIEALAELAGISRGLLYHYFASKREFHLAVLRRMADQVYAITAPLADREPRDALTGSLRAYVRFVAGNREAYTSFVRAAAAGDQEYRAIYDEARAALTDRIFELADREVLRAFGLEDSPQMRLLTRGWSSMVEDVVLAWLEDGRGIAEEQLLRMLADALVGIGQAAGSDPASSIVSPTT